MSRALILASLLPLAACQMGTTPVEDEMALTCGADQMQNLVGQPLDVLDQRVLPDPHRIIGPDMAVTMDWNPARLNVEHDAARIITQIRCG